MGAKNVVFPYDVRVSPALQTSFRSGRDSRILAPFIPFSIASRTKCGQTKAARRTVYGVAVFASPGQAVRERGGNEPAGFMELPRRLTIYSRLANVAVI